MSPRRTPTQDPSAEQVSLNRPRRPDGMTSPSSRELRSARRQPIADPDPRPVPLTPAQARIWAIQQRHPETTVFHLPFALRLRGKLSPGALKKALTTLGQRHDALRTTFVADGGTVTALVHPTFNLTVPIIPSDLANVSPSAAMPLFAYQVLEEMRRPFDLARGPLLRARLFNFAADDRVLVFTLHRLIGDEASVAILEQEFARAFAGHVSREPVSLPPLPWRAGDLAARQQRLIEGEEGARQRTYWTERLADLTPQGFPPDWPRTAWRTNHVARVQRPVPPALRERLTSLAQAESVPAETLFLAAVLGMLAGETGRDDVAVADRVDGRSEPGSEHVVANLANTVVIRADLSGDPSVRQAVQRVAHARDEALRHQELPFECVAAALEPDRTQDLADIVPVSFTWEGAPPGTASVPAALEAGGTSLEPTPLDGDEALSETAITVVAGDDGWIVKLTYATDLFGAERANALLDRLLTMLDRATRDPETPLSALTAGYNTEAPTGGDVNPGPAPQGRVRPGVSVIPARVSLVPLCTGDERRLTAYLCPGGAGNARMLTAYQTQFEQLALDRPVYAFLAARNPATDDGHAWTEATAAVHVRELLLRQPEGPYLLLGSCLGGILTMAMAQHMVDAGYGLPHVVLLDSRHPALGHMGPEEVWRNLTPPSGIRRRSLEIGQPPARPPTVATTNPVTAESPPGGSVSPPTARGEAQDGLAPGERKDDEAEPESDGASFFERLLYEPRYVRLKQYRPRPYPGPVTVLANQDWLTRYPALGWTPPAVAQLHLHDVPGDHEGFLGDSLDEVGKVLRPLLAALDRAG